MTKAHNETTAHDDAIKGVFVNLIAAISLLKAGGKKAMPSDLMFDQMIADCERAIQRGLKEIYGTTTMRTDQPIDRSRHYGLVVGDEVEERAFGSMLAGRVIGFNPTDNNCAYICLSDGTEHKAVAEYCVIIKKSD